MGWIPAPGGGYTCQRHALTFGALETCSGCALDPGPPANEPDEKPIEAPAGCLSSDDLERRAVEQLDLIATSLRSLRATKGKKENIGLWNTIAKITDNWIKAARFAGEYVAVRERRAHVKRLEARDRDRRRKR